MNPARGHPKNKVAPHINSVPNIATTSPGLFQDVEIQPPTSRNTLPRTREVWEDRRSRRNSVNLNGNWVHVDNVGGENRKTWSEIRIEMKSRAIYAFRLSQLILVTCSLAYMETPDLPMLLACGASMISGCVLDLYRVSGAPAAGTLAAIFAVFVLATWHFTKSVQHMEEVAKKYNEADTVLDLAELKKNEQESTDQTILLLGPKVAEDPLGSVQSDPHASSQKWLLMRAAELGPAFEKNVLHVLEKSRPSSSNATRPLPAFNLKTTKRMKEKVALEYAGNAALVRNKPI